MVQARAALEQNQTECAAVVENLGAELRAAQQRCQELLGAHQGDALHQLTRQLDKSQRALKLEQLMVASLKQELEQAREQCELYASSLHLLQPQLRDDLASEDASSSSSTMALLRIELGKAVVSNKENRELIAQLSAELRRLQALSPEPGRPAASPAPAEPPQPTPPATPPTPAVQMVAAETQVDFVPSLLEAALAAARAEELQTREATVAQVRRTMAEAHERQCAAAVAERERERAAAAQEQQQLRADLLALKDKYVQLCEERRQLADANGDALAAAQQELETSHARGEQLALRIAELQTQLATNNSTLEATQARCEQLDHQVAELQTQLATRSSALEASQARAEQLGDQVAELQTQLATAEEQHAARRIELDAALAAAGKAKGDLQDRVASLEQALSSSQTLCTTLQQRAEQLQQSLEDQTSSAAETSQLEQALGSSQALCTSLQQRADQLHRDLQAAQAERDAARGQAARQGEQQAEELGAARRKLQDVEHAGAQRCQELQHQVSRLEADLAEQQRLQQQLLQQHKLGETSELIMARQQFNITKMELATMKQQLDRTKQDLVQAKQTLAQRDTALAARQHELDQLVHTLATTQQELATAQSGHALLRSGQTETVHENASLRAEIQRLKALVASQESQLVANIQDLQHQNAQLQQDVAEARAEQQRQLEQHRLSASASAHDERRQLLQKLQLAHDQVRRLQARCEEYAQQIGALQRQQRQAAAMAHDRVEAAVMDERKRAHEDKLRSLQALRDHYMQTAARIKHDLRCYLDESRQAMAHAFHESLLLERSTTASQLNQYYMDTIHRLHLADADAPTKSNNILTPDTDAKTPAAFKHRASSAMRLSNLKTPAATKLPLTPSPSPPAHPQLFAKST